MNPTALTPFAFPMENMGVEALICYAKSQASAWKEFADTMSETYAEHHKVAKKPTKKTKKTPPKPEVVEPTVEPTVEPEVEPVVEPEVAELEVVEPVVEPTVEPEVVEPVVKPTVEPEVVQPVIQEKPSKKGGRKKKVAEPEVVGKTMEEVYEWFDDKMKMSGYAMKVFEKERLEGDIAKFLPEVESFSEEERVRFWNHVNKSVQRRQLEAHVVFLEDDVLKTITTDEIYQEVKDRFSLLTEEEQRQVIDERLHYMREHPTEVVKKPSKKEGKKKKVVEKVPEDDVDTHSQTGSEDSKTKEKKKREPTAYNLFVKEEIARIRAKNPDINHKTAMGMVAAKWKTPEVQTRIRRGWKTNVETRVEESTLETTLSA
jgi:hypothetical protein